MSEKDGGPAFPRPISEINHPGAEHETSCEQTGMSLRAYFAAAALPGIIGSAHFNSKTRWNWEGVAEEAYNCADAMLKEGEKE